MTEFSELGLAAPILEAIGSAGYTTPTPIQTKAIPVVLSGRDLLGIAQTGTGKTAAFALPILHRLATDGGSRQRKTCRALVLSPTRELAAQIADSFRTYAKHLDIAVAVVFGGVAPGPQVKALARGVDILVATPGRLLDHVRQKNVLLESTRIFVLDEADQMLDLGFVKPIRQIASSLSAKRQNLFFSATMPREISELAGSLLDNPLKVEATPVATTADRINQQVIFIEAARKKSLLVQLLNDREMHRTLVFTRTKRGADRVARHLDTSGIRAAAIHGNKSQRQRQEALEDFRRGKTDVLVATDIAARGIDIDSVTHVVNYELPEVPEAYVHRIGRTARAGASGSAIAFCDNAERGLLRDIERLIRTEIAKTDRRNDTALVGDPADEKRAARPERDRRSGRSESTNGRPPRNQQQARRGNGSGPRRDNHQDRPANATRTAVEPRQRNGSEHSSGESVAISDVGFMAPRPPRPDRSDRSDRMDRSARSAGAPNRGHQDRNRSDNTHSDRSERTEQSAHKKPRRPGAWRDARSQKPAGNGEGQAKRHQPHNRQRRASESQPA